nr:hypothetical protein [Sphingomonas sp. IC081]
MALIGEAGTQRDLRNRYLPIEKQFLGTPDPPFENEAKERCPGRYLELSAVSANGTGLRL